MAGALALVALGTIGGFTPGVATAVAETSVSPFAGSWSGAWTLPVHDESGTFDWTISDTGRISGRVHDALLNNGAVVGHVGPSGNLMFVGLAPNDVAAGGFNGFPFQGTAVIDGDGRLVIATPHPQNIHLLTAVLARN